MLPARLDPLRSDIVTAPQLEPRAVDVLAAAKALSISRSKCWQEVRRAGRLRSIRYERRVLIPVAALDEWLAAHETTP